MQLRERLISYLRLMRLHKPIGIWLLLWPMLWGLWIASHGQPNLTVLIVFVFGTIIMRSAGCVINDIADRHFDAHVARTKDRPLATKKISLREAIGLFIGLCVVAFGLVLLMNRLTIYLSVVAVLLAMIYPFAKRYTYLPQLILGAAFGWSIPMVFAAQLGTVPPIAWFLFLLNLLWTVIYDTFYAMVDRDDDLAIGVKSTAILFAGHDRLIIGILQIFLLTFLVGLGYFLHLNFWYYIFLCFATGLAVYQQYLIRRRAPQACFQAFLNNHPFGMLVFLGLLLSYLPG